MKKALLTGALTLALGISGISYAQTQNQTPPPGGGHCMDGGGPNGGHKGGKGGHGMGWGMMGDMNLTQKQQEQIRAIMDKERISTQSQIRAVLTAEQQKTFDQRRAQHDAWRQQRMQQPTQQK